LADHRSRVVVGAAASHSTLMNTNWAQVEGKPEAEAFRAALSGARDAVAAARPDVAVVVGSNHFRGLWLDLLPAFTLGVGDVIGSGEAGTPGGPLPGQPALGRHLLDELIVNGFDPAFSARLQIDHGITHAMQYLLAGLDLPVVPVIVNTFAAPLPTLRRCRAFGEALGRAIATAPGGLRVAVVASGGLSHALPWPADWAAPTTDDEAYMAEAWLEGRGRWADYDARRREIVLAAPPRINEDWDREVLAAWDAGRTAELVARYEGRVTAVAGNGGNEVRPWLIAAAACDDRPGETLCYSPMPEWLTGMGVGIIR
jgi:2,3-dihydroxyphenylpropionate 1,2-dioxygenase